jgi:hypothetical protein
MGSAGRAPDEITVIGVTKHTLEQIIDYLTNFWHMLSVKVTPIGRDLWYAESKQPKYLDIKAVKEG